MAALYSLESDEEFVDFMAEVNKTRLKEDSKYWESDYHDIIESLLYLIDMHVLQILFLFDVEVYDNNKIHLLKDTPTIDLSHLIPFYFHNFRLFQVLVLLYRYQ